MKSAQALPFDTYYGPLLERVYSLPFQFISEEVFCV